MSNSRNQFVVLAIIGVIGVVLYFSSGHSEGNVGSSKTNTKEFVGYDCTVDCSGHEAGYKWAEEHGINNGDDCDTAGEHSNSPSFAEGCHAYVDGESDPDQAADPDNEN